MQKDTNSQNMNDTLVSGLVVFVGLRVCPNWFIFDKSFEKSGGL